MLVSAVRLDYRYGFSATEAVSVIESQLYLDGNSMKCVRDVGTLRREPSALPCHGGVSEQALRTTPERLSLCCLSGVRYRRREVPGVGTERYLLSEIYPIAGNLSCEEQQSLSWQLHDDPRLIRK
jgi:hypothetical protein